MALTYLWSKKSADWLDLRSETYGILQREDTLKEIVKLLGPEALPDEEKLILEVARMIKIGILQQNSFDDVDTYCSPEKQFKLMKLQVDFYNKGQQALKDGASLADIRSMDVISLLLKARMDVKDDEIDRDKIPKHPYIGLPDLSEPSFQTYGRGLTDGSG